MDTGGYRQAAYRPEGHEMTFSQKLPPDLEALVAGIGQPNGAALVPDQKPKQSWRDTAVTAAILQTREFKPAKSVIPNMIMEGVNLLASRPKLGKSWMVLDIGIAAADNRYTLGYIKPLQGDVLYLGLEDSERRLRDRLAKLLPSYDGKWPARLHFNTKWRRFDDGGIDDLKEWCDSVADPVLIIIDVFTKVRPSGPKVKQGYEGDYQAVTGLQEFAHEKGIAVVLVHHDRKMDADDPFDTVSGTLGITGAVDTILILKRRASGVVLYARGRDIEEQELAIQFNRGNAKWTILGPAGEVQRSDERNRVIDAIKKSNGPVSAKTIMAMADLGSRNATDLLLGKMAMDGQVERVSRGMYALHPDLQKDRTDRTDVA
jgi:hypothetical protein